MLWLIALLMLGVVIAGLYERRKFRRTEWIEAEVRRRRIGAGSGSGDHNCFSNETMAKFLLGYLKGDKLQAVRKHVAACSECSAVVRRLRELHSEILEA